MASTSGVTEDPASFDEWLDAFFASYYRRRPVNATFAGVHDYDGDLPNLSPEGVERAIEEIDALTASLEAFPLESLSDTDRLDHQLATGALAIQRWEYTGSHFHRSNPCVYTGEAIFGVLSLFLTEYAPLDDRVEAAISRMESIPEILTQAKETLESAPTGWVERALRECDGGRALFGPNGGLAMLAADRGIDHPSFEQASTEAGVAFDSFQAFLETELLPESTDDYAAGSEALELVIKQGHFRDESPAEIADYAREQLSVTNTRLDEGLDQFDADTPEEALDALTDRHPSADFYYERHEAEWERCRDIAVREGLVSWPDFPLSYVPRPTWVREAAQSLYFLFYRSPAPFDDVVPVEYLLEPVDQEMDEQTRSERLRRWNDSQVKLNHVAHHGGLGHHVQNWHAARAESRIGQMAAVDTPYRIALCAGGTMAEGWACYASDLMADTGFLTPLEEYSLHQSRRRMAARAVVDIELHSGAFTAAEARQFYEESTGMSEAAARSEVIKNSMFPGMALMYLLGTDTIRDLRADFEATQGDAFDQRAFHDEFLSYGSVPVACIAARMRADTGVNSDV